MGVLNVSQFFFPGKPKMDVNRILSMLISTSFLIKVVSVNREIDLNVLYPEQSLTSGGCGGWGRDQSCCGISLTGKCLSFSY